MRRLDPDGKMRHDTTCLVNEAFEYRFIFSPAALVSESVSWAKIADFSVLEVVLN